jgi:MFS family permease
MAADTRQAGRGSTGQILDGGASAAPNRTGRPERDRHPDDVNDRARLRETESRQREEFGRLHWGSAFFGWLVAVGIATLLTALLSAAGAAVGLTEASTQDAAENADTLGIVGGVLLLVILLVAYYAGGYVAGRMARFAGPRQGLGVWVIGVMVTVILALAGALLGAEYNVLSRLNLPRVPIDEGSLTTGGLIALAAIVLGTLLAAVAGGKAGTRFHRKVDRAGRA